jgi:protein-S-isoprenylcysteine O-methyltransferase Ste14
VSDVSPTPAPDRPARLPWPSLVLIGCLGFGWAMTEILPAPMGMIDLLRLKGSICLAAGLALSVWAAATLTRGGTTTLPHAAAARLVTSGPFRFSRNPTYLGQTLIIAGFGALQASPWYVAASVIYLTLVTYLAILPEEAHLRLRFGEDWAAYRARVRRWL